MALGRLGKRTDKSAEKSADKGAAEKDTNGAAGSSSKRGGSSMSVAGLRSRVGTLVWTLFVLLALVLAVGALLVAIDANRDNGLVSFVLDLADGVDLGVFSRENGIREFDGSNAETKNALFNWGLGAVAYLVVGRLLERVIKP